MVGKDVKIIVYDEQNPEKPQVLTIPREEWNNSPVIHLTTATAAEHDKEPGIFVTAVKGTGGAIATGAKASVTGFRKLVGGIIHTASSIGHNVSGAIKDAADEYDQRSAAKKIIRADEGAAIEEVHEKLDPVLNQPSKPH